MAEDFPVVLSAGTPRVEAAAGLLQVAATVCVLDDLFREGRQQGRADSGVRVDAVAETPQALRGGMTVGRDHG